jgi:hypothetical protein
MKLKLNLLRLLYSIVGLVGILGLVLTAWHYDEFVKYNGSALKSFLIFIADLILSVVLLVLTETRYKRRIAPIKEK